MSRFAKVGLAVALLLALKLFSMWYARRNSRNNNNRRQLGGGDSSSSAQTKFIGRKVPRPVEAFLVKARAALPGLTDAALQRMYPKKHERHSHVVVVTMNDGVSIDEFTPAAESFARSFSPNVVDVVVADTGGIAGELREPVHSVIWEDTGSALTFADHVIRKKITGKLFQGRTPAGDLLSESDAAELNSLATATFTMHVEDGVKYCFDVLRVMFCSGNTTERMHFGRDVDASNETVVDMFAGIGYFTLPLAMKGHPRVVHALEKNPLSAKFLKLNAHVNELVSKIHVYCGDNREVTGTTLCGTADRVIMGYIPSCESFLPRAVSFLKVGANGKPRGLIHYHLLAKKGEALAKARSDAVQFLGEDLVNGGMQISAIREVKSYSPKKFHFVADLFFGGESLGAACSEGGSGRQSRKRE